MEESSEKRRERLQAMRMEASTQSTPLASSPPSSSTIRNLSNPLFNNSASDERTPQVPRFDYYSNPMAAFSDSRRNFSSPIRSPSPLLHQSNRPQAGPRNYHAAANHPPHGLQFQPNPFPNNQSPWRSPIRFQSPYSGNNQGTPPSYSPNPNSWNRSAHGHGGSPSPHSNSGSGNTQRFRGSGQRSGGRGRGFYNDYGSARHEPMHYYLKTMVKDPWRKLKPIIGSMLVPRDGSGSWFPKSIAGQKRAKVVEGGAKSQLSLAESLALSLEETVTEV